MNSHFPMLRTMLLSYSLLKNDPGRSYVDLCPRLKQNIVKVGVNERKVEGDCVDVLPDTNIVCYVADASGSPLVGMHVSRCSMTPFGFLVSAFYGFMALYCTRPSIVSLIVSVTSFNGLSAEAR